MTLDIFERNFQFELSWKYTFAKARASSKAVIPQPISVQGKSNHLVKINP